MKLKTVKKFKIQKTPGCHYRVSFTTAEVKRPVYMTASPKVWLLFAKALRDTIRDTHLKPVRKTNKKEEK
jgi:hypothetical protein